MRLMTNNPRKIVGLEGYGLKVVDRVAVQVRPRKQNARYLRTKHEKLGHFFDMDDLETPKKQEWW